MLVKSDRPSIPLPKDKHLEERVEMSKVINEKVKKIGVLAEAFSKKYRKRLHDFRQAVKENEGERGRNPLSDRSHD
ncbi:MAG TPA: hypothetical protein DCE56_21850 [Cyanobacteria bacterium UBA8553]|nr:hypothetical protein [Cyanobacteria bacterium UBA8553]